MMFYKDAIVEEVHRIRAELLEEYGGIEGLHKHMKEEEPRLIAQGWKFESDEKAAARIERSKKARAAEDLRIQKIINGEL